MNTAWINLVLKSTLIVAAGYLFYHLALRNQANFQQNRLYLMSLLILSFLLPLLPLHNPFLAPSSTAPASSTPPQQISTPPSSQPLSWLIAAYWGITILMLLRILIHLLHLYRMQQHQPRQRLEHMTLIRVSAPIPPFSFFNRIFIARDNRDDEPALRQIICHEAVHMRQLHSLDILICEAVTALQWFNPFAWFVRKALKETHEYLADREVIAQGFSPEGYRLLLFEQQFGAKLYECVSHLKQSQTKRRMFMMNKMNERGSSPYRILLALPLIALLSLVLASPRPVLADVTQGDDAVKAPVATKADDTAKNEELEKKAKIKEVLKEFELKEKALKEKYASSSSEEDRQKLKKSLQELDKKRNAFAEKVGIQFKNKDGGSSNSTDLHKKIQFVQQKQQKIKTMLGSEKDPQKIKELEQKLAELQKFEQEAKLKLESGNK